MQETHQFERAARLHHVPKSRGALTAKALGIESLLFDRDRREITTPMPIAHTAHLGDSRAYLFREGQLTQLTRDHTLVEKWVQQGLIDAATAFTHPERHVLTKALGMGADMEPGLTSTPIAPHDMILLCSDGLTKMLEDTAIASILSHAEGAPDKACHDLIEEALNKWGEDNVTVIVVAWEPSAVTRV